MVKLMFGLKRLPHLSSEEFHRYWREKHGVLATKNLPVLNAIRYVQSHTLDVPPVEDPRGLQGMSEPFDGVVEIWYESLEELLRLAQTPDGMKAHQELLDDERNFIDFSRSAMWFVKEEVFIDGKV